MDDRSLKRGNKSISALLVGAAMGAAAVFLSDKKNRDKIKSKAKRFLDEARQKLEEFEEQTTKIKEKAVDKLEDLEGKAAKMKNSAFKKLEEKKGEK